MPEATAEEAPPIPQATPDGSRWLHQHPVEEQVKTWFNTQPLHDDMEHEPYYGGIVVIPATEKFKRTMRKPNGDLYLKEEERAVFVPYVKVDTRIAYFWNLVRAMNAKAEEQDKYVGIIEPVHSDKITDRESAYYNEHLPEGFAVVPVRNADESISRFAICTMAVSIVERANPDSLPILKGIGTKQTPLARRYAEDNALMKAETGAVGRALGMAGILVVGTGVATAEDMQDAAAGNAGAAAAASGAPVLPEAIGPQEAANTPGAAEDAGGGVSEPQSAEQTDEDLRTKTLALQRELETEFPEAWAIYKEWWTADRKFGPLSELSGPALKGAYIKLERDLDAARQADAAPKAEPPAEEG